VVEDDVFGGFNANFDIGYFADVSAPIDLQIYHLQPSSSHRLIGKNCRIRLQSYTRYGGFTLRIIRSYIQDIKLINHPPQDNSKSRPQSPRCGRLGL